MHFTQKQSDALIAFFTATLADECTVTDADDWEERERLTERATLARIELDAVLTGAKP